MKKLFAYKKEIVHEFENIKGKPLINSLIFTLIITILLIIPLYLIFRYTIIQFYGVNRIYIFILVILGLVAHIGFSFVETIYYMSLDTITNEETKIKFWKLFGINLLNFITLIVIVVSLIVFYFVSKMIF